MVHCTDQLHHHQAALAQEPAIDKVTIVSTNDIHGALVGRVHSWSGGDAVGGFAATRPSPRPIRLLSCA